METETQTEPTTRALKTVLCPSLSGKATITYTISADVDGNVFLNLVASTGAGRLNTDLIRYSDIEAVLQQQPKGVEIRSATFAGFYQNQSTNSKGYLVSCLLAEGLLRAIPNKEYCYEACDPTDWLAGIRAMLETDVGATPKVPKGRKQLTLKAKPKDSAIAPVIY